jgi:hypothetical protein
MDTVMNVMSPAHPDWVAFYNALSARLSLVDREGEPSWDCQHDYRHARAVLASQWPQIDVEWTLSKFQDWGGFCDCEILLNAPDGWQGMRVMAKQLLRDAEGAVQPQQRTDA